MKVINTASPSFWPKPIINFFSISFEINNCLRVRKKDTKAIDSGFFSPALFPHRSHEIRQILPWDQAIFFLSLLQDKLDIYTAWVSQKMTEFQTGVTLEIIDFENQFWYF